MSPSKPQLLPPSKALEAKIDYVDVSAGTQKQQESNVLHAFKIDNIGLLLQSGMTSELLQNISICSLPNTNRVLYGMGNLRGNIIPVFDLRYLFGMPECENKYFLVIGEGENAVAILLDEIPLQIDIQEDFKLNSLPPMPSVLRPYVRDVYHSGGLWVDCDLMSFFECLQEYIN
jgi:twitching motility protein PilI